MPKITGGRAAARVWPALSVSSQRSVCPRAAGQRNAGGSRWRAKAGSS